MGERIQVILRWSAFYLLVIPAILRLLVLISPNPYFSFDPLQIPLSHDGLGPSGSLFLDSCSMLGCTLALASEKRCGRSIDMKILLLAIVPILVIIYHVSNGPSMSGVQSGSGAGLPHGGWWAWCGSLLRHPENLMTGSAWTAAVLTGVGAFHLAREPRMRILLVGAVVALAVPLAAKGLYQVTIEHGLTVSGFEQSKDAIFRANGWSPGSVEAKMYERRLMQPEATGWFGLSNVFGSYMACMTVFWMSMTLAAARTKLSSGWIGLLGLVTAAATAGLALTFSKGAIAAGVFGVVLSLAVLLPRRYRKRVLPWTFAMTVAVMILAVVAVAVRGAVLGAGFTADGYSLLFRWYYWEGAMRAFYHHWFIGVGPAGFKSAYLMYKPMFSPEEVASPHNIFVSYAVTLGVVGVSWIALVFLLLRRSSWAGVAGTAVNLKRSTGDDQGGEAERSAGSGLAGEITDRAAIVPALVVGLAVLVLSSWLNRESSYPDFAYLFWPMAMAGYVGLIAILPWLGRHSSWLLLRWSVWAGITVILLHSQIEMTMTRISAGAAIFMLLGAAAVDPAVGSDNAQSILRKISEWVIVGLVFSIWVVHAEVLVGPVSAEAGALARAATMLGEVGAVRQDIAKAMSAQDAVSMMSGIHETAVQLKKFGVDAKIEGREREIRSAMKMGDRARFAQVSGLALVDLQFGIKKLELARIGGWDGNGGIEHARNAGKGAVDWLEQARLMMPYDPVPWNEEVKLWLLLARDHHEAGDAALRDEALDSACSLMQTIVQLRPDFAVLKERLGALYEERAKMTGNAAWSKHALAILREALKQDPYSRPLVLRMARLADGLGEVDDAIKYYQKVLIIDDHLRLDPLKVMSESERKEIDKRISELAKR